MNLTLKMFYWTLQIKKIEMITPTQGIIGEATSNENTGIIAAITAASIAAVCLFLLAILLVRPFTQSFPINLYIDNFKENGFLRLECLTGSYVLEAVRYA